MNYRLKGIIYLCVAILTAGVLAVPLPGLFGDLGNASAADENETVLRIGFLQKVDSLNPYLGLSDSAYVFYGLVYDYLQAVDEDMNAVPSLATESHVVADMLPYGSVWEYNLTHNAYWHDGEPVTAEDVAWNINLNCMLTNYTDMWAYQPYMFFAKYAEVIDDDTVRVTFYDRETGDLIPAAFAYLIGTPMVPKHMLGLQSTSYISFQWPGYFTTTDPPIVGTGLFKATPDIINEFAKGDQLTLVRNDNYHWGADKGKYVQFDKLIMYFYDDDTAMKIALEQGQLDVAQFPPNTFRSIEDDIAADNLEDVETFSGLKCTAYWTEIGFNMAAGGPNQWRLDPAARHALAQAVNKTYIINNFYKGYAREGTGLISPVTPYWHWEPTAAERWNFDLTAAGAALEAAGYTDTNGDGIRECRSTSLAVQNGWAVEGDELNLNMMIRMEYPEEKEIAKFLREQWSLIGVALTYTVMLEDVLAKNAYAYGYDSMIWYWSADPDPNFMLFCQSKKSWNGWSDNYYSNPAYEENYTKSVSEFNQAERQQQVRNAQKISYDDAAYILVAYVYSTYAWRTDTFTGWGDWGAHPARSLDAFWTANPLFFDLVPTPVTEPEVPVLAIAVGLAVVAAIVAAVVIFARRGKNKRDIGEGGDGGQLGD